MGDEGNSACWCREVNVEPIIDTGIIRIQGITKLELAAISDTNINGKYTGTERFRTWKRWPIHAVWIRYTPRSNQSIDSDLVSRDGDITHTSGADASNRG